MSADVLCAALCLLTLLALCALGRSAHAAEQARRAALTPAQREAKDREDYEAGLW